MQFYRSRNSFESTQGNCVDQAEQNWIIQCSPNGCIEMWLISFSNSLLHYGIRLKLRRLQACYACQTIASDSLDKTLRHSLQTPSSRAHLRTVRSSSLRNTAQKDSVMAVSLIKSVLGLTHFQSSSTSSLGATKVMRSSVS
jgi:hypothetical protein